MRLRRARAGRGSAGDIAAFWTWWTEAGAARIEAGLARGESTGLTGREIDAITARVDAIHPGLSWELAEGRYGLHQLVVTAAGDPALRPVARRWLRAAPEATMMWEYADSRQATLDLAGKVLRFDGVDVALSDVRIEVRRAGSHLDVVVHHDAMGLVSADVASQIAFLALDFALGETAVDTWIGTIRSTPQAGLDAVPLAELADLVRRLAAEHLDADGEPSWVMLQGDGPEGPLLATAQVPLRASYAPQLDRHLRVLVPYTDRTETGFPGPDSLASLRDFEDHLVARLGGSGRLVAHETSAGQRVLHFYVDSTTPAADVVSAATGGWTQGRVALDVDDDPAWAGVAHLRA